MSELADTIAVPSARQRPLTGVELLIVAYRALSPVEQGEALDRLQALRLESAAGELTKTELLLGSLHRLQQHLGHVPTVADYRRAVVSEAAGEIELGLAPLSRIIPHFGSWRMATEALSLSEHHTPRRIEAMFANRRVGRVHRYSEQTLRETLERASLELGTPQTNAFSRWRQQEIEIARAQGDRTFQLPTVAVYRARWGTWDQVLAACGFTAEEIASRLERS